MSRAIALPAALRSALWCLPLAAAMFVLSRPDAVPDVRQVDVAEARGLVDTGALVLDVRSAEAYGHRHLPGAVSLPLDVLRAGVPATLGADATKPMVVYCGDGVKIGPQATQLLNQAGYPQAVNLRAGIGGWEAAGQPVVRP